MKVQCRRCNATAFVTGAEVNEWDWTLKFGPPSDCKHLDYFVIWADEVKVMELEEILKRTPGVILDIHLTYDIINHFQAKVSARDSNPDTGYETYLDKERFQDRSYSHLVNQIAIRLQRKKILI